jgi:hypothetical protein
MADNAEFDRGFLAGKVDDHARRLDAINGSVASVAVRLETIDLKLQRISDGLTADQEERATAAQALREMKADQTVSHDSRRLDFAQVLTLAMIALVLIGLIITAIGTFA